MTNPHLEGRLKRSARKLSPERKGEDYIIIAASLMGASAAKEKAA
jgi:hypothetical protein